MRENGVMICNVRCVASETEVQSQAHAKRERDRQTDRQTETEFVCWLVA